MDDYGKKINLFFGYSLIIFGLFALVFKVAFIPTGFGLIESKAREVSGGDALAFGVFSLFIGSLFLYYARKN